VKKQRSPTSPQTKQLKRNKPPKGGVLQPHAKNSPPINNYREIMEDLRVLRFFPAKIGVPNPPSNWEVLLFGVPPSFVKSHILGDIPLNFTI